MDKHLQKLAQELNITEGEASIFGLYQGHSLQIFLAPQENNQAYFINVLVSQNSQEILKKVSQSASFQELGLKPKHLSLQEFTSLAQELQSKPCFALAYQHPAGLTKKNKELLPKIVQCFVENLKSEPLQCQKCQGPVENLRLINNVLTQICDGCLGLVKIKIKSIQRKFETLKPNYLLGTLGGLVGSLAGNILWILLIILAERDWLYLTILAGLACGYLYKALSKKVDILGRILIFSLTLLGSYLAQAFYVVYSIYQESGEFLIAEGFQDYTQYLIQFENPKDIILNYLFPLIGAGYAAYKFKNDEIDFNIEE